jgi:hypothetical protein
MDLKQAYSNFYSLKGVWQHMAVTPVDRKPMPYKDTLRFYKGDFSIFKPVEFVQRKIGGSKICDIMSAGYPAFTVVSERVINAFKENGITGWGAYPVLIHTKKKGDLTNYYAFYITSVAEYADRSLCEKVEIISKSGKFVYTADKGFYFPLDSWDGSDIFYHEGSHSITVTERLKKLLEKMKATNFKFEPCSEYIFVDYLMSDDKRPI